MMKSAIASLFLVLVFAACSKDKNDKNDNPSKTEILTAKTWVYDLYITRYSQSNSIYQYKKGKPYNSLNLTNDWIKYETNGTYTRRDYLGATKTGTWIFVENETGVSTTEDGVTHTNSIKTLTKDRYSWYDSADDAYGELIPQ